MANQSMVQGLMQAVSRGESLHSAMMSFFNAGYSKEEIEESAREVQRLQSGRPAPEYQQSVVEASKKVVNSIPTRNSVQPIQRVSSYSEPEKKSENKIPEKIIVSESKIKKLPPVSNYGQNKKSVSWWMIIILTLLLLGLVGVLIYMIL